MIRYTKFDSSKPDMLTKRYWLTDDNELKKKTIAYMSEGRADIIEAATATEFADQLVRLKKNNAICAGLPPRSGVKIVSEEALHKLKDTAGVYARSAKNFSFPAGGAILTIDHDPQLGRPDISRDQLIEKMARVIPAIKTTAMVWWCSSSSFIQNTETGVMLNELRGQRLYVMIKDGRDIERAGKVLHERFWLADEGFFVLSKSASFLDRSIIDTAMFQTNRLDFIAGAVCTDPLKQVRPKPWLQEGELLDTTQALPDLSAKERQAVSKMKRELRSSMKEEAAEKKAGYIETRAEEFAGEDATEETLAQARDTVTSALERSVLSGDFMIDVPDVGRVSVAEVLDDPDTFHLKGTLDPVEPDYGGGRIVGKLYLLTGRTVLYSFAHGGKTYSLKRQVKRIEHREGATADAVETTLQHIRPLPGVYDYGQTIATVAGRRIHAKNNSSMKNFLGSEFQYYGFRTTSIGAQVEYDLDPSTELVSQLLAMPAESRGLKPLAGIVTAPVILPDATLVNAPGYCERSKLCLVMDQAPPVIPEHPTREQLRAAVDRLLFPFLEFPFVEPLDKTVLLAALLTAAIRSALDTAPAFAFDAPTAGTGKSKLAACVSALRTEDNPVMQPPVSGRGAEEETRKRLTSALIQGEQVMIWDNIVGQFDSAALAALLTSESYGDRVLGQSSVVHMPNKLLFLMTGNNLVLKGDMVRRTLICRVDAKVETPYSRKFDLDPLAHVKARRMEMVGAALTIIRGWLNSDERRDGKRARGSVASFETWEDMVRQPICWLRSAHNFDEGLDIDLKLAAAVDNDPERELLAILLDNCQTWFGSGWFSTQDLIKRIDVMKFSESHTQDANEVLSVLDELTYNKGTNTRAVGKAMQFRVGRIVDELSFEAGDDRHRKVKVWRVRDTSRKLNEVAA